MVLALKLWLVAVSSIMALYAVRHVVFTLVRLHGRQKPFYQDLVHQNLPGVTVVVPMHNEAAVASAVIEALASTDYPRELLEIIPIDDHSTDGTAAVLEGCARKYDFVRPLFRSTGGRGKPVGLNEALTRATHDVVLVFDADYRPPADLIRKLSAAFLDPEVGAVMGRVVPENASRNLLTRLLSFERSAGYQVSQQARYSLNLLPQYGGTVGGFRRSTVLQLGGFDPAIHAEDTDLTFRLVLAGWKVVYANSAECYEQVPETWDVRFRQLRRWSRGHTSVFIKQWRHVLRSEVLPFWQKVDAVFLLSIFMIPPLLLSGIASQLFLVSLGEATALGSAVFGTMIAIYSTFGNFAPVFEVGAAELLDGGRQRLYLLPLLFMLFLYNSWCITLGVLDAYGNAIWQRSQLWEKTVRFKI